MIQKEFSLIEIQEWLDVNSPNRECEWIDPRRITGYDPAQAKRLAAARYDSAALDDDCSDAPDEIITDYLCKCLDARISLQAKGASIPEGLNIRFWDYLDALIFLVQEFEASYAVSMLGSTAYHGDDFFHCADAGQAIGVLRRAHQDAATPRAADLIRTLILQIFHIGHPWGTVPRCQGQLTENELAFLSRLLGEEPLRPRL